MRHQAACDPDTAFTTLAHLIDEDFLREAYRRTSKSSAAGIDWVTAQQYAEHLDDNLHDLHERLRSGRYQAAPVERVWIEKEDRGQRPIGKPGVRGQDRPKSGSGCCWKRFTSKTFMNARMAFDRLVVPMMRCAHSREQCMTEGDRLDRESRCQ